MLTSSLNLNILRVFETVYSTRSMTKAAQVLFLTQSGVSQHIKSLEESLEFALFDRLQKKLVPTEKAQELFKVCVSSFANIEQEIVRLKGTKNKIQGRISIGMPTEFGQNILLPLLTKFSELHDGVTFNIVLEYAPVMNKLLLEGEVDFAFVDEHTFDSRIKLEKVYDEVLDMCISSKNLKKWGPAENSRKFYETLDYIDYLDGAPLVKKWLTIHGKIKDPHIKLRAYVANPEMVARFIVNDTGAGVLPDHVYRKYKAQGLKIECLEGSGRDIKNTISLAVLAQRTLSPQASELRDFLQKKIISFNN